MISKRKSKGLRLICGRILAWNSRRGTAEKQEKYRRRQLIFGNCRDAHMIGRSVV